MNEQLNEIFEAWNKLVTNTNNLPTATSPDQQGAAEQMIEEAYQAFDAAMEDLAVRNGHPSGKPRRRP